MSLHDANKKLTPDIFEQVKLDLDARNALGYKIHSRVLDDTVDIDWEIEAYQEALDLCVYLRGRISKRERDGQRASDAATRSRYPV